MSTVRRTEPQGSPGETLGVLDNTRKPMLEATPKVVSNTLELHPPITATNNRTIS
jgi:hypothetical protein